MVLAAKFYGTPEIKTSVAGENIVNDYISHPSRDNEKLTSFAVMNLDTCTVSIIGSEPIVLRANQGFQFEHQIRYIESFVFLSDGVEYQVLGAY